MALTGTVTAQEQRREDLSAAVQARRELGPDYEAALVESFLERTERELDARVAALAEAASTSAKARRKQAENSLAVALGSLGIGIPLSGIAGGTGGLPGLVVAWAGIVGVNVAHAWGSRRS